MSEEIRNENGELNDTELENASGGSDSTLYYKTLYIYCEHCSKYGRCGHSAMDLVNYILEHGDIQSRSNCPFYKNA